MKPEKYDFLEFLPWSKNIDENLYQPHIKDAYKFDVKPSLESLAVDIFNYADKSGTRPELQVFYDEFVRHWWVLLAFRRFIEVHGRNLTQFGYTKTRDPEGTFDQVSQDERAVIMKRLDTDIKSCYLIMTKETWKFDNITYRKSGECDSGRSFDFGIHAI